MRMFDEPQRHKGTKVLTKENSDLVSKSANVSTPVPARSKKTSCVLRVFVSSWFNSELPPSPRICLMTSSMRSSDMPNCFIRSLMPCELLRRGLFDPLRHEGRDLAVGCLPHATALASVPAALPATGTGAAAFTHLLKPLLDLFVRHPAFLHPLAHRLDRLGRGPRGLVGRCRGRRRFVAHHRDRRAVGETVLTDDDQKIALAKPSRTSTEFSDRSPRRTSRRSASSPI